MSCINILTYCVFYWIDGGDSSGDKLLCDRLLMTLEERVGPAEQLLQSSKLITDIFTTRSDTVINILYIKEEEEELERERERREREVVPLTLL